ncbi:hypothetical protein ACHHYP_12226 [Achlya hypogyna]|uniref:Uncharacterized protein n=1 Tax=Achlya hypogyna TaxID=1202772 RepID=A0A1V9YHC1_ACHHY|nr:hypothetical protein ACHHYP_12226 [Achlya hypogyna]
MDALFEAEDRAQRAEARRRRALARTGKKRQTERKRRAAEEQWAEAAARATMALEDASSLAAQRAHDTLTQYHAYQAAHDVYREATSLRKKARALHLDERTPGATPIARMAELRQRVDDHAARAERAAAASQRLASVADRHEATTQQLAVAAASGWADKMRVALREANVGVLEHLVARGADVDCECHCVTPLIVAVATGRLDVARALLQRGADPARETADGKTALLVAVLADDLDAVGLLAPTLAHLRHETKHGATAMLVACEKGRTAIVGHIVAIAPALVHAANAAGLTPLMQAARTNHLALVQLLLQHGASPTPTTRDGCTAADLAQRAGFRETAQICRGEAAGVRLKDIAGQHKALSRALAAESVAAVLHRLQMYGTLSPNHESPLGDMLTLLTCATGSVAQVQAALQLCRWTQPNRLGLTGAMVAAQRGRLDVLLALVAAGADLNQTDALGRDCFHHLHTNGHDAVARQLAAHKRKERRWWVLELPEPRPGGGPKAEPLPPVASPPTSPAKPRPLRALCTMCQLLFARKACVECQLAYCDRCYMHKHLNGRFRHHHGGEIALPTPEVAALTWGDSMDTCCDATDQMRRLHGVSSRALAALQSPSKPKKRVVEELPEIESAIANQSNYMLHTAQLQLAQVYRKEEKYPAATQLLNQILIEVVGNVVGADAAFVSRVHTEYGRVLAAQGDGEGSTDHFEAALSALQPAGTFDDGDLLTALAAYDTSLAAAGRHNARVALARRVQQSRAACAPCDHPLVQRAASHVERCVEAREAAAMATHDAPRADAPASFREVLLHDAGFRAFCESVNRGAHVAFWCELDALPPDERARPPGFALYAKYVASKKVQCLPTSVVRRLASSLDHSIAPNAADGRPGKRLVMVFAKAKRIVFEYLFTTTYAAYTDPRGSVDEHKRSIAR